MSYAHIENLYRPEAQNILAFKTCYALEKIHGTSAHIRWADDALHFFSGGENHAKFVALFDETKLTDAFLAQRHETCIVYGEAYGGKQQGMSAVYGPTLRFVAFDVQIGDKWLPVPAAETFVRNTLGLDFVYWQLVSTDLSSLDALRDGLCAQSMRNGLADGAKYDSSKTEGIVLRPPFEVLTQNGGRICAKHKRAEFCERKTPQPVDPGALVVLREAEAIAEEWVTPMRLHHVLDKMDKMENPRELSKTGDVIKAVVEDVLREGSGELVASKAARKAIGNKAAALYKALCTTIKE